VSDGFTVQMLAAVATFVASLIAGVFALVNLTLSKEQKVSEFRQAWIDALREDLSKFFSLLHFLGGAASTASTLGWEEMEKRVPGLASQRPILGAQAWELLIRIKLRLNMTEPAHVELLKLLTMAHHRSRAVGGDSTGILELERMIEGASEYVRPVLKAEWEVVKRGEQTFRNVKKFAPLTIIIITMVFIAILFIGRFC